MSFAKQGPCGTKVIPDIATHIALYLDIGDVLNLCLTCRAWRDSLYEEGSFRRILRDRLPFSQETLSAHRRTISWTTAAWLAHFRRRSLPSANPFFTTNLCDVDTFLLSEQHLVTSCWTLEGVLTRFYDTTVPRRPPVGLYLPSTKPDCFHSNGPSLVIKLLSFQDGILSYLITRNILPFKCCEKTNGNPSSLSPNHTSDCIVFIRVPIYSKTNTLDPGVSVLKTLPVTYPLPLLSYIYKNNRRCFRSLHHQSSRVTRRPSLDPKLRVDHPRIVLHNSSYFVYGQLDQRISSNSKWSFSIGYFAGDALTAVQIGLDDFINDACDGLDFSYTVYDGFLYVVAVDWHEPDAMFHSAMNALPEPGQKIQAYDCARLDVEAALKAPQDARFQRLRLICNNYVYEMPEDHRWRTLSLQVDERTGELWIVDMRIVWTNQGNALTRLAMTTNLSQEYSIMVTHTTKIGSTTRSLPIASTMLGEQPPTPSIFLDDLQGASSTHHLIDHWYDLNARVFVDLNDIRTAEDAQTSQIGLRVAGMSHKDRCRADQDERLRAVSIKAREVLQNEATTDIFKYSFETNEQLNRYASDRALSKDDHCHFLTSKTAGLGKCSPPIAGMNNYALAWQDAASRKLSLMSLVPQDFGRVEYPSISF